MDIFIISSDQNLTNKNSDAWARHKVYFKDHQAEVIIINVGSKIIIEDGLLRVVRIGGANKLAALIKTINYLWNRRRSKRFDLVSTQDVLMTGFVGYLWSKWQKIPLVVQLHGDYLDNPRWLHESWFNYLLNILGKFILRHSQGVRCVSERIRRQVVEQFKVMVKTIATPITTNLSIFSPQGSKAEDGQIVMFVGRLIPEKSPFLFMKVVNQLMCDYPKLQAVVAGTGFLQAEMQKLADEQGFGNRYKFIGHVDGEELAKWYRSAVCLIHTAAWEGWGMPMIEAMACGCPVVTTDSGCANEAVRDNVNGFVVPVDDAVSLIQAVKKLLDNKSLQQQFSQAAVVESQKWSFDHRAGDIMKFYEQVINQA